MRIVLMVVGLVLMGGGIAALMGKLHYTSHDEVLKVGGLSATVTEDRGFPEWASIGAIVVGGVLLLGGFVRRS
jgi:hypothetical protein